MSEDRKRTDLMTPEAVNQHMMNLMVDQLTAIGNLSERIAKLEVEVYRVQDRQLRLMAVVGVVGSIVGFASGHITTIARYLRGIIG